MISRISKMALASVLTLGAVSVGGCGGAQPQGPSWEPGPAITGLNLSGRWYSQDFGDMELNQTGPKVMGKYEHPRGPEHNGTIRGDITGDLLRIEWIQPGNSAAAVFPIRGRAIFRIAKDGTKIDGRWGYDDDELSGGTWKAEKSKF
jgi:hypothetical protein